MSLKATNNVGTNSYELEIEIPAQDFEDALQKAYLKARKNISLPGFRKGKAPRKLIEKQYGEEVFYEDAVNLLYAPVVNGAIDESGLDLVCQPEIEVTEIGKETGVKLKAKCTTKPEVEVKDYKGIEVEKVVNAVTDEDVQKKLDELREKNARIVTVDDRAAENGDTVKIDFEGFKDDVAFDGGKAEDFDLELGSGQFIPGFEEQIVGHSTGEEFTIDVKFPEEYSSEALAGQDAQFKITLHEIKTKELPEVDDEFVQDVSDKETLAEYREELKTTVEKRLKDEAEKDVDNQISEKLMELLEGEIPEAMYENQTNDMVRDFEMRLRAQGMDVNTYMQYMGMDVNALNDMYKGEAENRVKLRLALETIARKENIEVTEADLEDEYSKMAESYKMDIDKVKAAVPADSLTEDVKVQKALDLVKNSAVIK